MSSLMSACGRVAGGGGRGGSAIEALGDACVAGPCADHSRVQVVSCGSFYLWRMPSLPTFKNVGLCTA